MAEDFKVLIGIAYDIKKAQAELDRQVKSLQKNTKLALDIEITDKEAKKAISDQTKAWSNYRKEAVQAISAPNTELQKMSQYYKNLEKDIQGQISSQKKLYTAEEQAYKINQKLSDSTSIIKTRADAASKSFQSYTNSLKPSVLKSYSTEIGKISDSFKQAQDSGKQIDLSTANSQFSNFKNTIKATGQDVKSFTQILGDDISKFAQWTISATVLMQAISAVKNLISTVYDLDSSLTDLRQATGYSNEQAQELLNTYIDLGKQIGATGSEVASAASSWLRQGKSIADTNTLIQDSMILSKVGQIESADATKYLTAITKAYGTSVEDTLSVVDKLSAVDMTSATDVGGLAEAMSQVSTNAQLAGVSMDTLLGYIATIGETTQESMSSVGTSLNAIFSRMGNIKLSRLEDPETGESLNNVETSLKNVGISLRDANDSFRDFDDVLTETASNWDNYSDVEKRSIAASIAGVNHMEDFLVLMEGFGNASKYAATAQDSAGTAMDKFNIYTESAEAKSKKLQASLESLAENTLNSGLIKSFLDGSTELVDFADKTDLLQIALIALATAGATKAIPAIAGLVTTGTGYVATLGTIIAESIAATGSTNVLTGAMTALNTVMELNPALAIVAGVVALVGAIKGATALYDKFNTSLEEAKEKVQDLKSEYESIQSDMSSVNEELKTTNDRIDELNGKDNLTFVEKSELEDLKETNKELKTQLELLQKQAELNQQDTNEAIKDEYQKQYGSDSKVQKTIQESGTAWYDSSQYVGTGEEYVDYEIKRLQELNEIKKQGIDLTNDEQEEYKKISEYLTNVGVDYTNFAKDYTLDDDTRQSWVDMADLINKTLDPEKYKQDVFSEIFDSESFSKARAELLELAKAGQLEDSTISSNETYKALLDDTGLTAGEAKEQIYALADAEDNLSDSSKQASTALSSVFTDDNADDIDDYQSSLKTIKDALDSLSTGGLDSSSIIDLMQQFSSFDWRSYGVTGAEGVGNLESALKALAIQQYDNLDASLKNNDAIRETYNATVKASDAVKSYSDSMSSLNNANDLIQAINDDMKDLGSISVDTLNDIAGKYPELETLIAEYNAGLASSGDVIKALSDIYEQDEENFRTANNAKLQESESFYTEVYNALPDYIKNLAETYGIDLENFKSVSAAKAAITSKLIQELSDAWNSVDISQKTPGTADEVRTEKLIMNQPDIKGLKELENSIDSISADLQTDINLTLPKSGSTGSEKGSSSKESVFSEQIDWLVQRANVLNNTIDNLNKKLSNTTSSKSQVSIYQQLIDKQTELASTYQKTADVYQNEYSKALSKLSKSDQAKVKNGAYKIEQFSGTGDSSYSEQRYNAIQEAIELRDSMSDVNSNISDTVSQIKQYASELADIPWNNAEEKVDSLNSDIDLLNAQLDNTTDFEKRNELLGKILDKQKEIVNTYRTAVAEDQTNVDSLYSQIDVKNRVFNGKAVSSGTKISTKGITIGSDEYTAIVLYNKAVDELNTNTATLALEEEKLKGYVSETNDSIAENNFDDVTKKIEKYTEAISNLQDLASDYVDGSDEQFVVLNQAIQKSTEEVEYLKEQIDLLNKAYKNDKDNETYREELETLTDALDDANSSTQDLLDTMADALEANLTELTDDLTEAYNDQTDAINDAYDAYEKLINAKKESLEADKEAADYADEIADKTETISDIQDRMAELELAANSGDRSAAAELKDLQEELADAQEDLDDTVADHKLDTEEDALDKSLENYKDITDQQLEDAETVYNDKLDKLKSLYAEEEELIKHASDYTQSEFATKISSINDEIQSIISDFNDAMDSSVSGGVSSSTEDSITSSQSNVASNSSSTTSGTKKASILSILESGTSKTGDSALNKYIKENYGTYLTFAEMVDLAQALGLSDINDVSDVQGNSTNRTAILTALKSAGFKTGGTVDASNTYSELANSIGEDGIAFVKHNEEILTPEKAELISDLLDNIQPMNDLANYLSKLDNSNLINKNSSSAITLNIDSLISGVTVANDYDLINGVKQNLTKITDIITKQINSLQ